MKTPHDTLFRKHWKLGISLAMLVLLLNAAVAQTRYTVNPNNARGQAAGWAETPNPGLKAPAPSAAGRKASPPRQTKPDRSAAIRVTEAYGKLPLSFEANSGQTDPQVKFLARGLGYKLFLTSTEAVLALNGSEERRTMGTGPKERIVEKLLAHRLVSSSAAHGLLLKYGIRPSKDGPGLIQPGGARNSAQRELASSLEPRGFPVLRMKLVGANPSPRVRGFEELPSKSNYFRGNDPKKWRTNVPTYATVKYDSVYPGVDLVYYGKQGRLEYDFVVAPGADPGTIALNIQGAERINVDGQGDLVLDMSGEQVRFHRPIVYQPESSGSDIRKGKLEIDGRFVLLAENQVGFQVGEYDPGKPLVIDPVLKYSTYLGGSGDDYASLLDGLAVDPRGDAYVVGWTNSSDFPTTASAFQKEFGGIGDVFFTGDAFVAKLNAAGTALVYSTYLGGSADDMGQSLAVDAAGNAYLSGQTFSTDFPTMNPIQESNAGGLDSFVAKLNPTGDALVYSTYLGGSDWDLEPMIEIDRRGNLYAQGFTFSADFPTTEGAFQTTLAGASDTWVAKVSAAGDALVYSTYLGGTGEDICGTQIAVDIAGNVYLTGFTLSSDFPTLNPIQATIGADFDGFITKLNKDGSALVYSTYLGGDAFEFVLGTSVDFRGNAYLTGLTFSSDFPTVNPIQPANAGGGDAFVAKVNTDGTALVYSTYLGGGDFELGHLTAVDSRGQAYAVGITFSTDFPTANPLQAANAGASDVFLTTVNGAGDGLLSSTYLGGSGFEDLPGLEVDARGNIYVGGPTSSLDFPLVNPVQPAFGGGFWDSFMAKISPR